MVNIPSNYEELSWQERRSARELYVKEQEELCYHCKSELSLSPPDKIISKYIDWDLFPEGFLNHPIHLHHNHYTGMTIGAVHAYCNAVLWQYYGE